MRPYGKRRILRIIGSAMVVSVILYMADATAGETSVSTNILKTAELSHMGDKTLLRIHGTETPQFTVFKLGDPPRIVVDLQNADVSGLKSPGSGRGEIAGISATQFSDGPGGAIGRLVIRLTGETGYDVTADGNDLLVTVARKKANDITPLINHGKKIKKATEILGVNFSRAKGISKISISANAPLDHQIDKTKPGEISMLIPGADLPARLERTLDTTAFPGAVEAISAYRTDDGTRVVVKLSEDVANRLKKNKNTLVWEFKDPAREKIAARPKVLSSSPARAAGYTAETGLHAGLVAGAKKYKGRRISLDFKDADVHNILRLIAEVSHLNIVTSDDVSGKVTVRLVNVPWDQALDIILKTKGLGQEREGNIIRVAPLTVLEKEKEMALARKKAKRKLEPLKVRLIPVNYGKATDLLDQVKDLLSDRGTASVDERTNVIIVKDVVDVLVKSEGLIARLDTQTPQVLIEARIVEANSDFKRDVGIQWGTHYTMSSANGNPTGLVFPSNFGIAGGADDKKNDVRGTSTSPDYVVNLPAAVGGGTGGALGFIFGSVGNTFNLSLRLSAAEREGKIRIVSSPRITTLDNKEAKIQQGVSIPISVVSASGVSTVFVDATLKLAVAPHVTADGSIMMRVKATKNEPDFSRTGAMGDPTILKKEAKTEVLVRDGETTVIGGIYTRKSTYGEWGIPLLKDIPILGWLFKAHGTSDERTELLIFLTPRIVNRTRSIIGAR
ncbi:MAG: type IV pilus secretin PilQ [Deltaproteobacteria bacterium]|nr:type IV pilus secretin PilQ [Deltaproteobacteria bacterium]